ncbi:MAG: hypothetical protein V1790_08135 [Planctomycetota bacterium]
MRSLRRRPSVGLGFLFPLTLTACTITNGPPPAPVDPLAARPGTGTAQLIGVVRSAEGETPLPLGGVRLSLGDAQAYSNVDGSFMLSNVPAGPQPFAADGSGVQAGDGKYAQFFTSLNLAEEEKRVLERPIYLPFVPNASQRTIVPDGVTTATSGDGVTVEIPAGGARLGGQPYEGPIAIVNVAPDRTPIALPARFEGRTRAVLTLQPAGIDFPVPVRLTVPESTGDATSVFRSLWSLDGHSGEFVSDGVGKHDRGRITTTAGGVRVSGWHFFTELELSVREPCPGENADAARGCLAAAAALLRDVQSADAVRVPGARTLFGRLDAALGAIGNSATQADTIRQISANLVATARDGAGEYQTLYRSVGSLEDLSIGIAQLRVACKDVVVCTGDAEALTAAVDDFETRLADAAANVREYASRYDRLSAATAALAPFYADAQPLTTDALSAFHAVAQEFNRAYRDFAPFASPIDAYDALVDGLHRLEQTASAMVSAVSLPSGTDDPGGATTLQRVCDRVGTTRVAIATGGVAAFDLGESNGRLHEECLIVAMNPSLQLTSIPVAETKLVEALRSSGWLALTAGIETRALPPGQFESGTLTADAPVHLWTLHAPQRQGLRAAFAADGPALAGLSTPDGAVAVARRGGFDVVNLTNEESFAFEVYAADIDADEKVPYAFSMTPNPTLLDFGSPIEGAFDVATQAAVILFDGRQGQRVAVERPCCDPGGTMFSYALLAPDGSTAPRADFQAQAPGTGDEAFDLQQTGIYRLLVTPFEGEFPAYTMVVHLAPTTQVSPYPLGTEATAVIDQIGEAITYTFVAGAGQTATIEGLSTGGPTPVLVTITGPDGAKVVESEPLYFDGSSFATRAHVLPADGTYTISFSAGLSADSSLGSFTFRVTAAGK